MKRSAVLVLALASSLALVLGCGSSSKSGATAASGSGKPRATPKNRNFTDNGDGSFTAGGKKCKVAELIEDAENNDNQVIVKDGRNGYIYSFGDNNGTTMTPEANTTFPQTPGGAEGSAYAACVKGNVAMAPIAYAGIGFNLTDPKKAVDSLEVRRNWLPRSERGRQHHANAAQGARRGYRSGWRSLHGEVLQRLRHRSLHGRRMATVLRAVRRDEANVRLGRTAPPVDRFDQDLLAAIPGARKG
ncbi:MAG: hypothetical protein QM784_34285 [Polyangiaceae bacterium]